jgi:hypothetical protein
MSQVIADDAQIHAVIRELVPARVPELVGVDMADASLWATPT